MTTTHYLQAPKRPVNLTLKKTRNKSVTPAEAGVQRPKTPGSGLDTPRSGIQGVQSGRKDEFSRIQRFLNEDLVLQVHGLTDNLSAVVEKLLTDYVAYDQLQQAEKTKTADATCEAWNNFNRKHGSFADEYVNL